MIKPLRKQHLRAWQALALLLPLGIVSAWLSVPRPAYNKIFQPGASVALPLVVKTIERPDYTASLRRDPGNTAFQLEWINKEKLVIPSALIYQTTDGSNDIQHAVIVGRVEARGVYRFSLKKDTTASGFHFILYDIIHHRVTGQINF